MTGEGMLQGRLAIKHPKWKAIFLFKSEGWRLKISRNISRNTD